MTSCFVCPWKGAVVFIAKIFVHCMEIIANGTKQNVFIKYRAGLVFPSKCLMFSILFPFSWG